METISLIQLKKELSLLPANEVFEICMKLSKFNKENKALLHYLLYFEHDEYGYIETIKKEISWFFREDPYFTVVLTTKKLRKIINKTNQYIKYSKNKKTGVELLIHLCTEIRKTGNLAYADKTLINLYQRQIEKTKKALGKLHEDLQHDYLEELNSLV